MKLRCESKKQDTKLLLISSANVNRFSNFFTDGLGSKFATKTVFKYLIYNIALNMSLHCLAKYECQKNGDNRQSKIYIAINDKSQGSIAKHLRNDELL